MKNNIKNIADYEKAKKLGTTRTDRWAKGINHHPMSLRLMAFLEDHDFHDYKDFFCWKSGGDGDNGEQLMFEMDAFFEMLDLDKKHRKHHKTFFKKSNWEGKLLGRNYQEMVKGWKEIGYIIFADKIDGDRMVCSADINLKRIHVDVENGIITKVKKSG